MSWSKCEDNGFPSSDGNCGKVKVRFCRFYYFSNIIHKLEDESRGKRMGVKKRRRENELEKV